MCRSTAEGGRRCPAHSNPERVKAYNEIRRLRYKARKQAANSAAKPEPQLPELSNPFRPLNLDHAIYNAQYVNHEGQTRIASLDQVEETVKQNPDLNISTIELVGTLVEDKYFHHLNVAGNLNSSNLNEDSYRVFGFRDPKTEEPVDFTSRFADADEALDAASLMSLKELGNDFTPEEYNAAIFYSSPNYKWVNQALYEGRFNDLPEEAPAGVRDLGDFFNDPTVDPIGEVLSRSRTRRIVRNLVKNLDDVLAHGPKQQRILYRGVNSESALWEDSGFSDHMEWAAGVHVGSSLVFSGYQSSSFSAQVAKGYAPSGVLYEILTPEGVNISGASDYEYEREVVLPRNSQYTVVGKHEVDTGRYGLPLVVIQLVAVNSKGDILDGTNSDPVKELEF